MKAFIAALALVTLFSVPTFAQHAEREAPANVSPSSTDFGDNGN